MESAKLAPFNPVLSDLYLHPTHVVMGRDFLGKAGAGRGSIQGLGWVWGHAELSHWHVLAL